MSKVTTKPDAPGVIAAGESYTAREFCRRLRLERYAFDALRRNGLRVIATGKGRHVLGSDWLRFLEQQAEKQSPST